MKDGSACTSRRQPGLFWTESGDAYAVDWFAGGAQQASFYCLTHIHSDHTAGLFDEGTSRAKREWTRRGGPRIVCSTQTKALLVARGVNAGRIEELPLHQPCAVPVNCGQSGPSACLTLLDANHCIGPICLPCPDELVALLVTAHPCTGSVMFLVQWCNIHSLHTGDLR